MSVFPRPWTESIGQATKLSQNVASSQQVEVKGKQNVKIGDLYAKMDIPTTHNAAQFYF